jgi:hypothetical protein
MLDIHKNLMYSHHIIWGKRTGRKSEGREGEDMAVVVAEEDWKNRWQQVVRAE